METIIKIELSDHAIERIAEMTRTVVREELEILLDAERQATPYLTHHEACQFLKVSDPTLARWRKRGLINGRKMAGKWLYTKKEIEEAADLMKK